jgi:thiamine-phosphate pyrophosphorylase
MDELLEANGLDVDYVAVSPVFATHTKTDTLTPFGYEGLERACRLTRHPICGIGGMNAGTAGEAIASGADGVAVVSAIMSAPDPYSASINLRKLIENELDKRSLGRIG